MDEIGGDEYYKAQLPEFFQGIHDPSGEYLSILNDYKLSSGLGASNSLMLNGTAIV